MANILKEKSLGIVSNDKTPTKTLSQTSNNTFFAKIVFPKSIQSLILLICLLSSLFLLVYCRSVPVHIKEKIEQEKVQNQQTEKTGETPLELIPDSTDPVDYEDDKYNLDKINSIINLEYNEDQLQGIFWREKDFSRKIYLTFDDGPNMIPIIHNGRVSTVSDAILDTLKNHEMQAVFFINGKNLEYANSSEKEEIRKHLLRVINEGHLLGNHSYNHYNLAKGSFNDGINDIEEIGEEFVLTQNALNDILGFDYPLVLTRPPYAEPGRTQNLDIWLRKHDQYLISLQFDSYDYAYSENGLWNKEAILNRVSSLLNEQDTGGVILLHELESTAQLLSDLIDDVIAKNMFEVESFEILLEKKYGRKS